MRDINRFDMFYEEIKKIHKDYFPDWRFGQLYMNFFGWIHSEKNIDPFFPEENRIVELLREYTKNNSPWYMGGELFERKDEKNTV